MSALIAARAALETRDFDAVEVALARPEAQAPSLAVPRLMLEAETALRNIEHAIRTKLLREAASSPSVRVAA